MRTHRLLSGFPLPALISCLLFTACLEFQEHPLDTSNGGLTGNLAIFLSFGSAAGGTTNATVRFVVLGDGGKGYTSTDGANWTDLTGVGNSNVNFKKVIWTGTRWLAIGTDTGTTSEAIYYSTDGTNWTGANIGAPCGGGTKTLDDMVMGGSQIMAVGSTSAGTLACVHSSTDDGLNWTQTPATVGGTPYVRVAHDGTNFLAVNGGSAGAPPNTFITNGVSAFSAAPTNPSLTGGAGTTVTGDLLAIGNKTIFVGLDAFGVGVEQADASVTTNSASTWLPDTTVIFDGAASPVPRALAISGPRTIAVGDSCRVDYSDDSGDNWLFNGALPSCSAVSFEDVIFDSTTSALFAVGLKSGMGEIWSSLDNGVTWGQIAGGLTNTPARTIAFRP